MQFLSDLYVRCAECEGRRFQPHVLKVKLHGKSIHDLLKLTVSEAIEFFAQIGEQPKLSEPLAVLEEVGLGYLRLGQPLNALSGGESQRLKLVRHLTGTNSSDESNGKPKRRGSLFIFDEPTVGLHFDDVSMLLRLFQRLVERGHSIVVIEHNLEVIKCADWIVDLGPEGGDEGGKVVASGTPEQIACVESSHTGEFLRSVLADRPPRRAVRGSLPRTSYHENGGDKACLARAAEEPPDRLPAGADWQPVLPRNRNGSISIHGAREHNLKNISVEIPRDEMVVITGLSGSGKSTLAFDILFAEGQRRFLDSMSPYARQREIDCGNSDRGLSFPSASIRQDRHAILSRLRFAGGETKRRRDRETGRSGGEAWRAQGSGATGEGAQRLPYRRGALGGAAGFRYPVCRRGAYPGFTLSKAGTIQGTHHRCSCRRQDR